MPDRYKKILEKLTHTSMLREDFLHAISTEAGLCSDAESEYELLKAYGVPLEESEGQVYFSTSKTPYKEQRFCIVDIETNGSLPENDQIIELGAILYEQDKIIDTFESLIFCKEIPEHITKITGISAEMLKNSPKMKEVLERFRLFLGDCVFVAHNVSFDYGFLSAMMERSSLGFLCNRRLCTIDLARKTIPAERYGLPFLNEFLGIHTALSHRAYADALTTLRVFEESLKHIPSQIHTTEELISFCSVNKSQKPPKKTRRQSP